MGRGGSARFFLSHCLGKGCLSPAMSTGPQLPTVPHRRWWGAAAALLILLLPVFQTLQGAVWDQGEGATAPQGSDPRSAAAQGGGVGRRRRYADKPLGYKWDHVNLTYKIVQFPSTLNKGATERAIATAFRMWSDVSPLSFRHVAPAQPADITIGFYTFNHTDCWFSPLHPCFDGLNGELAHAFLPPRGEIHFDNHEFWILGRSRFSWKQGVWLNDLVQVAAHEIGHALGLWHSQDVRALMHPNATYSRIWRIGQDDAWAVRQLYGCVDEKQQCEPWARRGFCTRRRAFMNRHCPQICNSCSEPPAAFPSARVQRPHIHTKYLSEGRVITFRCGLNTSRTHLQISWYKDGVFLSHSVPGLELLLSQALRVHATMFSEGQYTCLVHRASRILRANSWQIKLKARNPSPHQQPGQPDAQRTARA